MGCASQEQRLAAAAQNLVQISKRKRVEAVAPKRVDFHCSVCGHVGPHREHSCPGERELSYVIDRAHHCDGCRYREGEICTLEKSVHPDRECSIPKGIRIPEAYCKAGNWDRVQFNCPECGSVTFNEMGANRCKNCGFGKPLVVSLPHRIVVNPEPPLEATKPFAVITIAAGQKALDLLELTGPPMQAYADRCGADFHAIKTNQHPKYPLANKFRLRYLSAEYERVLFVDVDVWIRSSAPDLFQSLLRGLVWAHMDYPHIPDKKWVKGEAEKTAKEQAIDPIRLKVLNTGVVMFENIHRDIWKPPVLPIKPRHLTEQTWVEYNIARTGYPLGLLDTAFNTQWWMPKFRELEPKAHFIHLASCPHEERIYRLRKYRHAEANPV